MTIVDQQTTGRLEHAGTYESYVIGDTVAITRGRPVAINSSGQIGITVASFPLAQVLGVAMEDIAVGAVGTVIVGGFCDFLITDGNLDSGDVVVAAVSDGTYIKGTGYDATDLSADTTLGFTCFGRTLGVADSAADVGVCRVGGFCAGVDTNA